MRQGSSLPLIAFLLNASQNLTKLYKDSRPMFVGFYRKEIKLGVEMQC